MTDFCEHSIHHLGSIKSRNVLTSYAPVNFLRKTLDHGVSNIRKCFC